MRNAVYQLSIALAFGLGGYVIGFLYKIVMGRG